MQTNDGESKTTHKLIFLEDTSDSIREVLGVSDSVYEKTLSDMMRYMTLDAEEKSFTDALRSFIESHYFSRNGFVLETENDYFMLGYMFNEALRKLKMKEIMKDMKEIKDMHDEVKKGGKDDE